MDHVDRRPRARHAASLGTGLHDHAVLPLGIDHQFALAGIVAHRLLAVDVLAVGGGEERGGGMPVVGGGDHDRVDPLVGDGAADVTADRGRPPAQPGELLRRPCGRVFVHVHDGPDLDPRHLHDVGDQVAAALVNAHHRDHDRVGRGPDCAAGREGAGRGHPDVQELPAADHIRRVHG